MKREITQYNMTTSCAMSVWQRNGELYLLFCNRNFIYLQYKYLHIIHVVQISYISCVTINRNNVFNMCVNINRSTAKKKGGTNQGSSRQTLSLTGIQMYLLGKVNPVFLMRGIIQRCISGRWIGEGGGAWKWQFQKVGKLCFCPPPQIIFGEKLKS